MGKYNAAVTTTAGDTLITQALGGTKLTWTHMRTSSAVVSQAGIKALTALTDIEQTADITDATVYSTNVLQVSARFSNTNVATAYLIKTVGIYGQLEGGSETLIAVMTAETPDEMPVYDADAPSAFIFTNHLAVQDAASVTMGVNDTGTATVAQLALKVDKSGGDISNTKVVTIGSPAAEYPEIQAGASVLVILGRVKKFLADLKANCLAGLTISGRTLTWTKADGTTGTLQTQDTTYSNATTSAAGLMSAADKTKLNGIASGAQVNSITGVKGNAESTYRTGQVNITPANVGAAPAAHASADTTYGLGSQAAYGHVKIIDSLAERAYAAGEVLSAHMGGQLQKNIENGITGSVVSRTSWTWGASFDSSQSYATAWRSGDVVVVTLAAAISAAIPAKTDRNILTNLPVARNRVYATLTCVSFDSNLAPSEILGTVMCAIRPEDSATTLKVDKNLNPTACPYGAIYGTFAYITSEA